MGPVHASNALPALTADVGRGRRLALMTLAGLAAVGFVFHLLHETLGVGGHAVDDLSSGVVHNVLELLAAVACLLRAAWVGRARVAWLLMGLGITSYAVGETLWFVWLGHLESPPFPSVSDAFWLSFYVLAFAALGLLARERVRVSHATLWLDGAMGALVIAALGIAALFERVLATSEGSFWVAATNLAYPILDLLLLAAVVAVFAVSAWRPGRMWATLGTGCALLVAADIWYIWKAAAGIYLEGGLIDPLYTLALIVIAAAAWQRTDVRAAADPSQIRVLALPSLFVVSAAGLLGYGAFRHVDPIAIVFALATLALVVLRTALTFREVRQLADTRRQALTDDLTGLPNRRMLLAALSDEVSHASADGTGVALLLIDLDGFKELNDTLGHHVGDTMLQHTGRRLREALHADDVLARLGGDEFAALLVTSGEPADAATAAARRLLAALERPFVLDGISAHVDASIGAGLFPDDSADVSALLRHADVAMYAAKRGRTRFELYREEANTLSRERVGLLGQLRDAIDAGQLVVHFQPKAELATGRVTGVEALVRWDHPEHGLMPPGRFLPAAEQTGLIRPLTLHVLDRALAQAAAWRRAGTPLDVAVNLSVVNLLDSDLAADVSRLLDRHAVPGSTLSVEVTESAVMSDPERVAEALEALRALGVQVALDDFGTGYSSLSLLTRLPVDEIKIDRSFVSGIGRDAGGDAIVRTTIELARSLSLRVVAEGVETDDQWRRLAALRCDAAQGYLLGRPAPAAELDRRLRPAA